MNKETKNLLDRIVSIMYENVQLSKENKQLKSNIKDVKDYVNGYFTKGYPLNSYVIIEKLERNLKKNGK